MKAASEKLWAGFAGPLQTAMQCITARLQCSGEVMEKGPESRLSPGVRARQLRALPRGARHLLRPTPGLVPVFIFTFYNGNYCVIRQFLWKIKHVSIEKGALPEDGPSVQVPGRDGAGGLNANPAPAGSSQRCRVPGPVRVGCL